MLTTRRRLITGSALALSGFGMRPALSGAVDEDGISHTAESIHQQPDFTASRASVYAVLTDAARFDRLVTISGAKQAMHLPDQPSRISPHAGGAFAVFGGFISGRQVELVRNELIVQAWRAGDWPRGVYSVVRFELLERGSGCRLIFDQSGFPQGEAQSLASGWRSNYWEPIRKLLA